MKFHPVICWTWEIQIILAMLENNVTMWCIIKRKSDTVKTLTILTCIPSGSAWSNCGRHNTTWKWCCKHKVLQYIASIFYRTNEKISNMQPNLSIKILKDSFREVLEMLLLAKKPLTKVQSSKSWGLPFWTDTRKISSSETLVNQTAIVVDYDRFLDYKVKNMSNENKWR